MTLSDTTIACAMPSAHASAVPVATSRDIRLDFFRGIAIFIILIAHIPNDWLALWTPSRFGFSDATEIFVFCSGMASALAFGRIFRERGLGMGTVRVAHRLWQVYWAHIGLFFALAMAMVALNALLPGGRDYVGQLNLHPFFKDTPTNLLGLMTLTYVPNYFDILPMYMVILAMVPLVIGLARMHLSLAAAFCVSVWIAANFGGVNFPAEPWSQRPWFFNPFGWQLVFFTGFAFMAGWIPAPPVRKSLFFIALAVTLVTVPFAYFRIINEVPEIAAWRADWKILINKTDFGILRFVHFLAIAYIAWVLVGPEGNRLRPQNRSTPGAQAWQMVLAAILKVGQQSLAIFVTSMFLARLLGALFDHVGRTHFSMLWVNLLGCAMVIAIAYGVGWLKSQPWKKERAADATS